MSTTETWKVIPGFSAYEASDQGRIRRATRAYGATVGRILKPTLGRDGRLKLVIKSDDGEIKGPVAARLILYTFEGPPPSNLEAFVQYRDEDATNIALANIYWGRRRPRQPRAPEAIAA